jgi:hypothetical protein
MQTSKLIAGSLCQDFYAAIVIIADPAADPEHMSLAFDEPAEPDALDASANDIAAGEYRLFAVRHVSKNAEVRSQNAEVKPLDGRHTSAF